MRYLPNLSNEEAHAPTRILIMQDRSVDMLEYRSELRNIGPVAIKMGQREVRAAFRDRQDWDMVSCPGCPDRFFVGGPHPLFPSRFTKDGVTSDVLLVLAEDHSRGRIHQNSYASWD